MVGPVQVKLNPPLKEEAVSSLGDMLAYDTHTTSKKTVSNGFDLELTLPGVSTASPAIIFHGNSDHATYSSMEIRMSRAEFVGFMSKLKVKEEQINYTRMHGFSLYDRLNESVRGTSLALRKEEILSHAGQQRFSDAHFNRQEQEIQPLAEPYIDAMGRYGNAKDKFNKTAELYNAYNKPPEELKEQYKGAQKELRKTEKEFTKMSQKVADAMSPEMLLVIAFKEAADSKNIVPEEGKKIDLLAQPAVLEVISRNRNLAQEVALVVRKMTHEGNQLYAQDGDPSVQRTLSKVNAAYKQATGHGINGL